MSTFQQLLEQMVSEELLDEAAKEVGSLDSEHLALAILPNGAYRRFILYNPYSLVRHLKLTTSSEANSKSVVVGYVLLKNMVSCDAWSVQLSAAEKGYGPAMYDIAMSNIAPEGMVSDRSVVSDAASRVWRYMFTTRAHDFIIRPVEDDKTCASPNQGDPALDHSYAIKNPVNVTSLVKRHLDTVQAIATRKANQNLKHVTIRIEEELKVLAQQFFSQKSDGQ